VSVNGPTILSAVQAAKANIQGHRQAAPPKDVSQDEGSEKTLATGPPRTVDDGRFAQAKRKGETTRG
jgi:hypothetical protein